MTDWVQVGEDFRQKYEGTYCRYLSPITKKTEIFAITKVRSNNNKGPDISLFNSRAGEIFLNYSTDAELDFSFPECRYFQHKDTALRFIRRYERQWKKGICLSTASISNPYAELWPVLGAGFNEETLASAFNHTEDRTIAEAIKLLEAGHKSVALSRNLALGSGSSDTSHYLWFESEPIGELAKGVIHLHVPQFRQELQDYIRRTEDYARIII